MDKGEDAEVEKDVVKAEWVGGGGGSLLELKSTGLLNQDADTGETTLVYAHNGFNELSRLAMLWTVRHRCPEWARFEFNCYGHWAHIFDKIQDSL